MMKHRTCAALALILVFTLFTACQKPPEPEDGPLTFDQALEKARGTTVNFYMWGGSATINAWVDGFVTDEVKQRFDITLKRVPMDASVFVNKLLTEKQAGKSTGTIDLMWINGENFKNARQAGLLYGPVADRLPSVTRYVDPVTVTHDFGFPVDHFEVPYGRAQFIFVFDTAKTTQPPDTFEKLSAWIKAHPGRFTYPQPPDFTGSAFIRQVFYAVTGGHEQYMPGFDEALYLEKSPALWQYLEEIQPFLWQKGRSYPKGSAALDLLFEKGEVDLNMSYHQAHASNKIMEGKYPDTVRTYVMKDGSIYNTHFTAIAFNAPNRAGAMVVANFLASPPAQLSKNDPANWGDFTVLDMDRLSDEDRAAFSDLDLGPATLPLAILGPAAVPEIPSEYLTRLETDWQTLILDKQ